MAAFERTVGAWLAQTGVAPDDAVAIDGKTLRGAGGSTGLGGWVPAVHLVAVYAHRAQAVLAQLRTAGQGHELAAVQAALPQVPLAGRLVTGDALLTQRERGQQVVAAGGDYLLPVKANQPALHAALAAVFSPVAPQRPRRGGSPDPPPLV